MPGPLTGEALPGPPLKGVAPLRFVEEMNQLQGRQRYLGAELATRATPPDATSIVLRADLAHIYRAKFGALTAIFEDDALRAEVFRREKPPAVCTEGVLQIKLVAGAGFEPATFRL